MESDNLSYLRDNKVIIKKAIWNVDVPKYKILGRNHLKTQVARAFLPEYFSEYDVYIWLDADMWLNDLETFKLYEEGAIQNCIAITPQSDRSYFNNAKVDWFLNFPLRVKTINFKILVNQYQENLEKICLFHLNAGAIQ